MNDIFMDIISVLGTIFTLVIAWMALKTWKKQLKGTDEYQLSKNILKSTYEVQEEIKNLRYPMVSMSKEDIYNSSKLEVEMKIYADRYARLIEKYVILKTLVLEAKVLWNKQEIENLFNPLFSIVAEINGAIWLHFWLRGAYSPLSNVDQDPERLAQNDRIIYDTSSANKEDEFSRSVTLIVEKIELFIQSRME